MKKPILLGFSINTAEHVFFDCENGSPKIPVRSRKHFIEGSSVNAAVALSRGNVATNLVTLTGPLNCFRRPMLAKLQGFSLPGVTIYDFPILNESNHATVMVGNSGGMDHRIYGSKGIIDSAALYRAEEEVARLASQSSVALLTSLQPQELSLAKVVARSVDDGQVVMTLHSSAIKDQSLREFLALAKVLVVNESEAKALLAKLGISMSAIHDCGPEMVVVTRGDGPGEVWLKGASSTFEVTPVESVCTVGAGDNFAACLASSYKELGSKILSSHDACKDSINRAVAFVAEALRSSHTTLPQLL